MKRMWISAAMAALAILGAASVAPAQNPARQFSQFGTQRGNTPAPAPAPATINNMPTRGSYLGGTGSSIPNVAGGLNSPFINPFNAGFNNPFLNNAFNNPYGAYNNYSPYNAFNPYSSFANPYGASPFLPTSPYFNPYQSPLAYPANPFMNPLNPYTGITPWQNPLVQNLMLNPLVNPSLYGATGQLAPWQYPQLPFQNPAMLGLWGASAFGSSLSGSGSVVGVNNGGFAAGAQR